MDIYLCFITLCYFVCIDKFSLIKQYKVFNDILLENIIKYFVLLKMLKDGNKI